MIDLAGKTAWITGAAHGIGRAIAQCFAAAGANVALLDTDGAAGTELARELDAVFLRTDVSVEADVRGAAEVVRAQYGPADVLVNNAAYLGPAHAALDSPDEEWERGFAVTLQGVHRVTRAALAQMIALRRGSIVNIASVQALAAGRNSAAYTSFKTALLGYTRSVAYDYGPMNIRANAICPGAIRTRISPPEGSELHRVQISKTFLARTGQPEEVAWCALFLASDRASYITGAAIPVDGGWAAM